MKTTLISMFVAAALIVGAIFLTKGKREEAPANNVVVADGKQIITLTAKGGYTPLKSVAQAGLPTILRMETTGTFDCSLSVRIPAKNLSQVLPPTGMTDIDLGTPEPGIMKGTCGMGMYPFEIDFRA